MKIVLLGKDGQLGWELQRSLAPLSELIALSRKEINLENTEDLPKIIADLKPDILVNATAYTAVDKAEEETEKAFIINAKAVQILAEEAKKQNAWFVHYSTDYVFEGEKQEPYLESDQPSPLNVYGQSKWAGEKAIQEIGGNYLIFRTSWVYATRGKNFAKTILRLASEKEELKIISDQFGAPTSAELIADITALALYKIIHQKDKAQDFSGLYHLTAGGRTTWHEYTQYLIGLANEKGIGFKVNLNNIYPILSNEYPVAAKRPKNSCLNTDKIKSVFGINLPDWKYHIHRLVDEVLIK